LILIIQTFLFLFSSLLRLPLTSNLFPYTTLFRSKIVGYATGPRMTARLAVAALEDAVARRGNVNGCIVHSDRGSQGVFNRSSQQDRKSTRLNSSHVKISYAVFCLKKKKNGRIPAL